jgi:hypothetical protein
MPIVSTDIKFRLSGGAANADPNASLGGAKSSVEIVDATLNNLFDQVSGAESAAGDTEYRCLYANNAHATLTLLGAKVWIQTNTPAADTDVAIGLGSSAVNGTEQTVADESTAPTGGVTFSAAANEGAALAIGDVPAGQHKAIWLKRVITAGAAANALDSVVLRVKGDTAA